MFNVLWLQGASCGGCTMAALESGSSGWFEELRSFGIHLLWHPSASEATGSEVVAILDEVRAGQVRLDAEGRVRRFQCLAPTEWNFHPRGPLARMLRGATVALDRGGRDAIARLIAAFDPCVGYRLAVRELADA
jgi:hypothetical protein